MLVRGWWLFFYSLAFSNEAGGAALGCFSCLRASLSSYSLLSTSSYYTCRVV